MWRWTGSMPRTSNPKRSASGYFAPATDTSTDSDAYDIMLADCFWHVYRMLGKLSGHVYLLSKLP